jgi:hypothetical protein
VACIVETSMAYGREILWGVAQYLQESGPWTVSIEQRSLTDHALAWSHECRCGFTAALQAAGHGCAHYRRAQRVSWGHQQPSWEVEVDRLTRAPH